MTASVLSASLIQLIFISAVGPEQLDVPKVKLPPKVKPPPKKVTQMRLTDGLTVNQPGCSTEVSKPKSIPPNISMFDVGGISIKFR